MSLHSRARRLHNPSNGRGLHKQPFSARHTRAAAIAALSTLTLAASACSDSLRALGPTPAAAEHGGSQLFDALATRFSANDLSPKYDLARVRIAQRALTPSKVFDDTAVWEARPTATSRAIYIHGFGIDGGRYRLETRPTIATPAHLGDTRHTITLEHLPDLGESVYRWDARVDLAIGTITAEQIGALLTTLLAAGDGRAERDLRDDYRAALPRAIAAFGRGFTIDSVRATPGALGTTNVVFAASFRPELMRPAFPALAKYLDKYLGPAKYHFALAERGGPALFDVVGRERTLTMRYRLQQGKLTSLFGPPKPWPDTVQLTSDVSLKVKLFTVGFSGLVSDFAISNTGHERAFAVIAQREPQWQLPLFTESLIRSSLRRPFEGQGSMFRIAVRDSAGAQSTFSRRTRLDVQESTIMRFLGGLASHAIGELDTRVEAEEDRFFREGVLALQADLRALAPRWK